MATLSGNTCPVVTETLRGNSSPLGATVVPGGVNFSLFSRDCTGVELLLFDRVDDARPSLTIALNPKQNRTYHYWHLFVPGLGQGQMYGYRVSGPNAPDRGLHFDPEKLLLDHAWQEPLTFELPAVSDVPGNCWHRWLDTSLPSPADIVPLGEVPVVDGDTYSLPPHSLAVMLARAPASEG